MFSNDELSNKPAAERLDVPAAAFHELSPQALLSARLRQEAAQSRPAFSESLHARVMDALEQEQPDERPSQRASARRRRLAGLLAMAALALSLLAAVVAWKTFQGVEPTGKDGDLVVHQTLPGQPVPVAAGPTEPMTAAGLTDLTDRATQGLGALADVADLAAVNQEPAYLDHDVRLAAQMLLNRLPLDLSEAGQMPENAP